MSKLIFTLVMAVSTVLAQSAAPPTLMHLYPVAFDAAGEPVTDLTMADFKISDQGKPVTISFFRRPRNGPPAAPGPMEYSNRPRGSMQRTVAILFDLMNESQPNRMDTWHAFTKSLPQLESGEGVYFYLLNLEGELVPIHGIGPKAADDQSWPKDVAEPLDKAMKAYSHARPAHMGQEDQVKKTFHQLEVLANQLAAFPGRRDILWITDGVQNVYNTKLPCNGDWVDCALYVPHLAVTLANAAVSVDPVSYSRDLASGVSIHEGQFKSYGALQPKAGASDAYGDQQARPQGAQGTDPSRDLEQMARLTGGRPYFRQDIREVLKQVSNDAVNAYEIAYDPSTASWDNKFHMIHVTCERKGVRVLLRDRYYALPDTRPALDRQRAALVAAYQSQSDAANIGLRAKLWPSGKAVHLEMRINASDVLLSEQGGKVTGAVTYLLSDLGASGPLGDPSMQSINLDLTKEQHDMVMKEGIPISQDHAVGDAVQRVRLIVMDQSTNAVGSLTFPVK
ncbi:MAG TPA: VWA domain-containing protein [Bryobacteraceae bacterium]|nr:VWA domain-containing protein [Bryobacteraceae bacterium]